MKSNLLHEFEEMLDKEAYRIFTEMVNMYNNRVEVNKPFNELVADLIKKEFDYYFTDIEIRIYFCMGNKYAPDNNDEYALMSMEERNEDHLMKYAEHCIKERDKNHIKAANEMADILIEFYNQNSLSKMGLAELIASNMSKLFPKHNDSVDSRAMVLYLQSEIEDKGYEITSLQPFRLIQK